MKMIATTHFGYQGKDRKQGDEFDVSPSEARLLQKLKRASPAAQAQAMPAKTRDVRAEGEDISEHAKAKKGRYSRRDMRADDTTNGE